MMTRIGDDLPAVRRVRQVESGPAARQSSAVRQAGAQAAAVVRIGAEGRARAAAAAAEARAAAATPREPPEREELSRVAVQWLDFHVAPAAFGGASSPHVPLTQFTDQLARAKLEP